MPELDSFALDPLASLPDSILAAVAAADLPGLADGPANRDLAELLGGAGAEEWPDVNSSRSGLCRSGLWLLAGDLDRSHSISQDLGSAEGSFWHGIMHRREGDFGNAKYWFRRVGSHPVFESLVDLSEGDYTDPFQFVDEVSRAVRKPGQASERCVRAQWLEWQALMAHCLHG